MSEEQDGELVDIKKDRKQNSKDFQLKLNKIENESSE